MKYKDLEIIFNVAYMYLSLTLSSYASGRFNLPLENIGVVFVKKRDISMKKNNLQNPNLNRTRIVTLYSRVAWLLIQI